jgi:hypothetical protein
MISLAIAAHAHQTGVNAYRFTAITIADSR